MESTYRDRLTDRQAHRQEYRQASRKVDRQTDRQVGGQACRWADRQTQTGKIVREIEGQAGRQVAER